MCVCVCVCVCSYVLIDDLPSFWRDRPEALHRYIRSQIAEVVDVS